MGCALAEAAMAAGHQATLVLGPVEQTPPKGVRVISVTSALQMQNAAKDVFVTSDVLIAAAAVSDWRPAQRVPGKPARQPGGMTVELVPNPDIVAGLAANKGARVVIGFALESVSAGMPAAIERGRRKIVSKHLDAVVVAARRDQWLVAVEVDAAHRPVVLVEAVEQRAHPIVPQLHDTIVQRGQHPRPARMEGQPLHAVALGFKLCQHEAGESRTAEAWGLEKLDMC